MHMGVKAHNNSLVNEKKREEPKCNCRNKQECPLPGKCTIENVIYETTIATTQETKKYIGLTSNTFKTRFTSHKSSFNDKSKRNSTELSKYIWHLKEKNAQYNISWKVLKQANSYSPKTNRCNLCLWEKYHIITANNPDLLNSRSELISTCRHKRKFLLSEYG